MDENPGKQASENKSCQPDGPKQSESINFGKGKSRVSMSLLFGGAFGFFAAWAGLYVNFGHKFWILAVSVMLIATICAALGLRLELRNHHWRKGQYNGVASLVVVVGFSMGIPIIVREILPSELDPKSAIAKPPPLIRSRESERTNVAVYVGRYATEVLRNKRATNFLGPVFFLEGTNLFMDCSLYAPKDFLAELEIRSNRLMNYTHDYPHNEDERAYEIVDRRGKVFFQFIKETPTVYTVYGMFRSRNPVGIWVAEPGNNYLVESTNVAAREGLTNGLGVKRIFRYPASIYPSELDK